MGKGKKGGKAIKLPLPKLMTKARLALDSPALVGIARSANSPNSAYELAYLETGDVKASIACQNLAKIKRDYGKAEFDKFVSSVDSHRPRPEDPGKSKGENPMEQAANSGQGNVAAVGNTGEKTSLPLKGIVFRSTVSGINARVRVIQKFENDAKYPVEAVYVFPLPDEATVIGCRMKIGQKSIVAELKKREQARREYDQAVSAGHHGALMEQERPNIFTMNVGGIEPGESIEVEIDYVQRIPWQDAGGRFSIPLVVAPRFIPGNSTGKSSGGRAEDTDEVPDASRITPQVAREGVSYSADINIFFAPGFACEVTSPSHEMMVSAQTLSKKDKVEIKTGELATDRDFILVYRSLSKVPEVAVQKYLTDEGETFVSATIFPSGQAKAEPSDYALVLDGSGSMSGAKNAGLKVIAKKVLENLKAQSLAHRACVIMYDDRQDLIAPLGEINDAMISAIDRVEARGSTYIGRALTFAYRQFTDSNRPKIILLVSDGQSEDRNYTGSGARIVTVGIDSAVNDTLLKELAQETGGACQFFFPGEDFTRAANTITGMLSGPVLSKVKVECENGEVVGVSDVFEKRPTMIAVRFVKGANEIRISGKASDGSLAFWDIKPDNCDECDFLAQVWARERIRETKDKKRQAAVSLKYGVICDQTSFVAISEKEIPGQKPVRVEIPVNLPHGWDFEKVFGQGMPSFASFAPMNLGSRGGLMKSCLGGGDRHMLIGSRIRDLDCGIETLGLMPEDDDPCLMPDDGLFEDSLSVPDLASLNAPQGEFSKCQEVCDLIQLFQDVSEGKKTENAQIELDRIQAQIESQISQLAADDLGKAFYFLKRISSYGLVAEERLERAMFDRLRTLQGAWYELAKKEMGLPAKISLSLIIEENAYIFWKFGRGLRPTSGIWAQIP